MLVLRSACHVRGHVHEAAAREGHGITGENERRVAHDLVEVRHSSSYSSAMHQRHVTRGPRRALLRSWSPMYRASHTGRNLGSREV